MNEYIDKKEAYNFFSQKVNSLMEELKNQLNNKEFSPTQWASIHGQLTGATVAKFYIIDIPTANVKEVIYAHWILEREPNGKPYCYHCSNCDSDFHNIGIKCASKYCPNCGATMDERIEDNG